MIFECIWSSPGFSIPVILCAFGYLCGAISSTTMETSREMISYIGVEHALISTRYPIIDGCNIVHRSLAVRVHDIVKSKMQLCWRKMLVAERSVSCRSAVIFLPEMLNFGFLPFRPCLLSWSTCNYHSYFMMKQLLKLTLFSSFFAQRIFMRESSSQWHFLYLFITVMITSQQAQLHTHCTHRKHEPYIPRSTLFTWCIIFQVALAILRVGMCPS